MNEIVIGTRGSRLALTQADLVTAALRAAHPNLPVRIEVISTIGDRMLDVALAKIGDKGLFVKEIEAALLSKQIDLAVHSAKDLPSLLPDGLHIAAVLPRGDPRDALVLHDTNTTPDADASTSVFDHWLPPGACVGTSSLRRASQLRALRPDLNLQDVRGNVDTRLRKLAEGQYDALVLAAAGLERLGLIARVPDGEATPVRDHALAAVPLAAALMLPAVGQGVLAIEARSHDTRVNDLLRPINHAETHAVLLAERAFLRCLEGGCQTPIAAHAVVAGQSLSLIGSIGTVDGVRRVRGAQTGRIADAEHIGTALAEVLLADGGEAIVAAMRGQETPRPLEGVRVVVTRAEGRNEALVAKLRAAGAVPIVYPVIAHVPPEDGAAFDAAMRASVRGDYDWVILTSATTVNSIAAWLGQHEQDEWPKARMAAIGPATAQACQAQLGQRAMLVPEYFDGAGLATALGDLTGQRVLLLNADIASPALHAALRAAGTQVDRTVAYRIVPAPENGVDMPHLLLTRSVDAITFTSGSTVRNFLQRIGEDVIPLLNTVKLVCLGATAAEALAEAGLRADAVAGVATEDGLIEAIVATRS